MAALVCDICGGKLIMGAGGKAICDSCGMEYSTDRIKEKVLEIKGTVRVDNSHMIENYLQMAQSEKEFGKNAEAESYCNKIIEIEPTNYKALMLKGKAVVWQSSLEKPRVDEGLAAFVKAINNAPDEVKDDLVEEVKEEIKKVYVALISTRADIFARLPTDKEAQEFLDDTKLILGTMDAFIAQTGKSFPIYEMQPIASLIDKSVIEAWHNVIWPEFNRNSQNSDDITIKLEYLKFMKILAFCGILVHTAIGFSKDDEENILRYKNLIRFNTVIIKSYYGGDAFIEEYVNDRRIEIREYEAKIKEIEETKEKKEKEEAKKRFEDYWSEHANEKTALETEKAALQEKIASLRNEIHAIPGSDEKKTIQDHIDTLNAEKDSLGLFKWKEKKAVQEKIDAANLELKKVVDRMDAEKKEIENKIHPLQQRIDEIDIELTKER